MEVSIKRARDLQKAASAAAKKISIKQQYQLTIFNEKNPDQFAEVDEAIAKIKSQLADIQGLVLLSYRIKKLYGKQNDSIGVTSLLRDIAAIDDVIARLTPYSKDNIITRTYGMAKKLDREAIQEQISINRRRLSNPEFSGSVDETITISLMTDEIVESVSNQISALERQKAEIQDQLAFLNATNKIRISDEDVELLQAYKLI